MRFRRPGRPSPALVIAVIALFVALGGTGYAAATGSIDGREIKNSTIQGKDVKNSSLTGSDVKNNSLTGSDVQESKLGKVPSAATSDKATTAGTAGTAGRAGSAGSADTAKAADNSAALGGVPASGYQRTGLPAFTPATTQNNWAQFGSFSPPGYWKDASGVVNIQGGVAGGTNPTVFTLPAGFRPTTFRSYAVRCSGGVGAVEISGATGTVNVTNVAGSTCSTFAFLDGITFRTDN